MGAVDDQMETERKTGDAPSVPGADNRWISDGPPSDNVAIITRNRRGRFGKGTVANPKGLFKKGKSGNPKGRPKGRFRSGTRAAAALLDAEGVALAQKAIELALGGDAVAVRFCLGRILGVRRGQPVELGMKPVAAPADLSRAVAAITGAVAQGRVTPDEGHALSRMLDGLPRVFAAVPPPPKGGEDPCQALIREMDRLAAKMSVEERRASLLEELAALDAEKVALPDAELDIAVAEQQEQDQDHQQETAEADPAAIAIA